MLHLFKILGPVILVTFAASADNDHPFIHDLNNIKTIASTVPSNGDVNPYGIALRGQSILVSNFNNSANLQGTGTTIDEISADGSVRTFAQLNANSLPGPCPGGVGLTTALVSLRSGFVIVGSLPTTDGTSATAQAGCLIVLDGSGKAVSTLSGNGIDGPWDMTALDLGGAAVLFVSNVLNGTVMRIVLDIPPGGSPRELARTVIGSGFPERFDPAALVIGPTGLGLMGDGSLAVADTLGNRIASIPAAVFRQDSAGTGMTVSQGGLLNGPLGLAIAPNGDILTVNSGDGNLVDIAENGQQTVKAIDVSHQGAGTLFGLTLAPDGHGIYFVDDGNNTLNLLH
jgi:hypothetical protein